MKTVFAVCIAAVIIMYIVAQITLERPEGDGAIQLRWATDPNPARKVQTGRFTELQSGEITLSIESDAEQRLIVQCATGVGPDIIDIHGISYMGTYVDAGILLDLTDYAKEMGFSPENTYPAVKEALMVEGRQYRFPCSVNANCVVYNKAVFDDHGLPYPENDWTYEDFIELGKRIRATPSKSGARHIPVANWAKEWLFQDILVGYGGHWFSKDGLKCVLDSPEAIAAMQLYYDLMHVHKVIPTAAETSSLSAQGGWGGSTGLNFFFAGRAAMIFIGRWCSVQVPNYPELKEQLGAVQLPRAGSLPSAGVVATRASGINVKSPRKREALKFLQYLSSSEYGQIIVNDGDALPPNPALAQSGKNLVNSIINDPDFHQPFVDALKTARPIEVSPFIDAALVQRLLKERIDLVENQLVTPSEAMRELANEINQKIRLNLERQENLQDKYRNITGKPYIPGW